MQVCNFTNPGLTQNSQCSVFEQRLLVTRVLSSTSQEDARGHTRAPAPTLLTWKYNLSMGVASDIKHVGAKAS